jgi:hypothetical protein
VSLHQFDVELWTVCGASGMSITLDVINIADVGAGLNGNQFMT